ncbi:hypothetical protein C0995_004878 [Termitomyces sp. Mi166|nr:hypothetical protein C0995_004878 [Termitomyces sp. Mi166\
MSNTATPQVYFDGIRSVPAAAVLAALYFVFLVGFVVQWLRFRSSVYPGSATVNVGLLIGEEILTVIGFYPLLNAMNQLLYDRETGNGLNLPNATSHSPSNRPMSRILRFHAFYRLLILSAIVIGSVGLSQVYTSDDPDNISAANSLHITSAVLFLVLILYLACQTAILSRAEAHGLGYSGAQTNFGGRHRTSILMGISILLLIREVYDAATARDRSRANNEHLWYPLLVLPEILAVLLFAIPGLVPVRIQRSEVVTEEQEKDSPLEPTQSAPGRVESQVRLDGISDSPPQLPSDLVVTSKSEPGLIPS